MIPMMLPETGSLRVSPDYEPDCDWCGETENVFYWAKAQKHLCEECYDEYKREVAAEEK